MSYDWDKNCAVVDRMSYWQYFLRGTTVAGVALVAKDLYYIKINYYADRARKRLPIVFNLIT
jgi:hypothetical protein